VEGHFAAARKPFSTPSGRITRMSATGAAALHRELAALQQALAVIEVDAARGTAETGRRRTPGRDNIVQLADTSAVVPTSELPAADLPMRWASLSRVSLRAMSACTRDAP